jgi:tripartite-type tricarboxylate transporter receptor subunit TctC
MGRRTCRLRWSGAGRVLARLAKDKEWLAGVHNIGSVPNIMPPAETMHFVEAQYRMFNELGKKLDIQIK